MDHPYLRRCKANGMNYSTFMHGLKVAGIQINRKMLSEMAITIPWRLPPCARSPRRRNFLHKQRPVERPGAVFCILPLVKA